jgi:hypothetical protein
MNTTLSLPEDTDWPARAARRAAENMRRHHGCSQSIIEAFFTELHIAAPGVLKSAGGMMGGLLVSHTCGIHTAGMMILGMFMGREDITQGLDGLWPIVVPGQRLMRQLDRELGAASCRELTGVDFTDLDQAMAFMAADGHRQCTDRVEAGACVIAGQLTRMHREGALFSPGTGP